MTLGLGDEHHDFLAAVWIANRLERRLSVERWNLLGYPAFEVLSHHLSHVLLHLRVVGERGGLRRPNEIFWACAVLFIEHFFD